MADKIGIAISGLCSFLFWPYPLTSNDPAKRARGMELARQDRAGGARSRRGERAGRAGRGAYPVAHRPRAGAERRVRPAREGGGGAARRPQAEKLKVSLNIENIFFNGYLMTPDGDERLRGLVRQRTRARPLRYGQHLMFQFPEHWVPMLGRRIKNIHLKEFTKKGTDYSLETFRPLLDGTTNWPAVMEALDATGYQGYLTFEYLPSVPALPRGADLPDLRFAGPDARAEGLTFHKRLTCR